MFALVGFRHQDPYVLAHRFAFRIAEDTACGGIERLDDALFVYGDDGIAHRVQDGGHPPLAPLEFFNYMDDLIQRVLHLAPRAVKVQNIPSYVEHHIDRE